MGRKKKRCGWRTTTTLFKIDCLRFTRLHKSNLDRQIALLLPAAISCQKLSDVLE